MQPEDLSIVEFESRHREAFRDLNYAWIRRYFSIEPSDRKALEDPETSIIAAGGRILMAELGGEPVGTCALLRQSATTVELAKMAVDERLQGTGIGKRLGEAAIERARAIGAVRLVLESNRRLTPALGLYRRLGFVEIDGGESVYSRCDIQMGIDLSAPPGTAPSTSA